MSYNLFKKYRELVHEGTVGLKSEKSFVLRSFDFFGVDECEIIRADNFWFSYYKNAFSIEGKSVKTFMFDYIKCDKNLSDNHELIFEEIKKHHEIKLKPIARHANVKDDKVLMNYINMGYDQLKDNLRYKNNVDYVLTTNGILVVYYRIYSKYYITIDSNATSPTLYPVFQRKEMCRDMIKLLKKNSRKLLQKKTISGRNEKNLERFSLHLLGKYC